MQDNKKPNDLSATIAEMTEATMLGTLMQCVIEQVKVLPKPWQALSESQQREYLDRVEAQMRDAVKRAVFLLAAQESVTIPATVTKVVFKDGVKAELELTPGAPGRHDLADAEGETVHSHRVPGGVNVAAAVEALRDGRRGWRVARGARRPWRRVEAEPRRPAHGARAGRRGGRRRAGTG